jgi:hypothetical protein
MTIEEVIQQYASVADANKASFLLTLSHQLTVQGRSFYDAGVSDSDARKKLTGLNELQHHLSAEAGHHTRSNPKRYPNDVLIKILEEKAAFYGIGIELATAWHYSIKYFTDSAPRSTEKEGG